MAKKMLIDALHAEETRVVIADDNQIFDFDFVSSAKDQLKGNIYLAKITRVEPSLQAAFVEYGGGKQGFLPFSEIHPDYYQIPMQDRIRLMEEVSEDDSSDAAAEPAVTDDSIVQTSDDLSAELPPVNDESQRPAYLMQGAIEASVSSDEIEQDDIYAQGEQSTIIATSPDVALPDITLIEEPAPNLLDAPVALIESPPQTALDLEPAVARDDIDHETAVLSENTQKNEEVETLPNEEEEIRPKKNLYHKRYKIQEVIRRGQIVLVQVIKEERGNKGCSLTTFLSLAGRYCVLMPNSPKDGGISRKIMSPEDRKRLKSITTELKLASGMSVIIRTAGMDRTRAEIKRDYDYLVKLWNQIREDTLQSTAPALIYEESNLIKRSLRDLYTSDIDELVIEGEEGYLAAKEFMKLLLPSHTGKIKHYTDATPLFYAYNIEEQLLSMHDPVVKLKSGGYIVLNPTEALISIDVNSGRATGERNIEETALKTNMEAAAEVARQLRLRDLAGLVVIDFIDMMESRNRRSVERALKDALKNDRAKIQLGRISPFGLLEMSRQRLRSSLAETNMVQCPHCAGRGYVRSNESLSIQIMRAIEKEGSNPNISALKVYASQDTALHLLNTKREALKAIEDRQGITVTISIDPAIGIADFTIEKIRRAHSDRHDARRKHQPQRPRFSDTAIVHEDNDNTVTEAIDDAVEADENAQTTNGDKDQRRPRRSRGGRRRGRRDGRPDRDASSGDNTSPVETINHDTMPDHAGHSDDNDKDEANSDSRGPRRRQRGGRRRWKDRDGRPNQRTDEAASASSGEGDGAIYERPQLPAFANQPANPLDVHTPKPSPTNVVPMSQPAASEASSGDRSTRKGWWQKMINLDN